MPINREYLYGPDIAGERWLHVIINTYDKTVLPVPKGRDHYATAIPLLGSEHPTIEDLVGGGLCLDAKNVAVCCALNMSSIETHTHHDKATLDKAKTLMHAYLKQENITLADAFKIHCY